MMAWINNGALQTQALDPVSLLPAGPIVTIEGGVLGNDGQAVTPALSLSDSGVLVYRRLGESQTRLAWFNLAGRELGVLDAPPRCRNPEFSPKGDRVAVECTDSTTGRRDIWLVAEREPAIRLTDAPGGASIRSGRPTAGRSRSRRTRAASATCSRGSGRRPASPSPCSARRRPSTRAAGRTTVR